MWTGHGFERPFKKPADIPANYVPFNIQNLNGLLYVAYAELIQPGDPDYNPEEPFVERTCAGCSYVAVFNRRGLHVRTLEGRERQNAPWGLAIAPENFGRFSNALLVGNFGDGTIVGFDLTTGQQIDYLRDPQGKIIAIPVRVLSETHAPTTHQPCCMSIRRGRGPGLEAAMPRRKR